MKAVAMFAALVIFAASAAQAQSTQSKTYFSDASTHQKADIAQAVKAYEGCLDSDNEGVQESAMAHLAMLKLLVPEYNTDKLASRLEQLSTGAAEASTRYKAYIASQVFRNPAIFASAQGVDYRSADEFFGALAGRLQSSYLSYGGQ